MRNWMQSDEKPWTSVWTGAELVEMGITGGRADLGGRTVEMSEELLLNRCANLEIRNGRLRFPKDTRRGTFVSPARKGSKLVLDRVELHNANVVVTSDATCHMRGCTVVGGHIEAIEQGATLVMHGCDVLFLASSADSSLEASRGARIFLVDVCVVGGTLLVARGGLLDMQGGRLHRIESGAQFGQGGRAVLRGVAVISSQKHGVILSGEGSSLDMEGGEVRDNASGGLIFLNGAHGSVRNVALGINQAQKIVVSGGGSVVEVVDSLSLSEKLRGDDVAVTEGGLLKVLVREGQWAEIRSNDEGGC